MPGFHGSDQAKAIIGFNETPIASASDHLQVMDA